MVSLFFVCNKMFKCDSLSACSIVADFRFSFLTKEKKE